MLIGYTAFSVGLVNNRVVYIPIPRLVATSPRVMDPFGRTWERVLASTGTLIYIFIFMNASNSDDIGQPQHQPSFDSTSCTIHDRTMI